MQIQFSPFLYIVSLSFSLSQTIYAAFQTIILAKKDDNRKNINSYQKIVLFFLFISLFIFDFENFLGIFVSYSQRSVKFRAVNSNAYEKIIQFIDVIFDVIQKSTSFTSIILFQPIFKKISNRSKFSFLHLNHFIVSFSIIQFFFFPLVFFCLNKNVNLSIFFMDIFLISEDLLILFMFSLLFYQFIKLINEKNISSEYKKIIFKAEITDVKIIFTTIFVQIFTDFFYKCSVLITSLISESIFSNIIFDYSCLFRLISISLQLYYVFKLCSYGKSTNPNANRSKVPKSSTETEEDVIGPKNMLYFTQPNENKSE
ncbi:hypothetical protein H312_00091 [Anncaliia algerae PRA339]|uniref:Transmembrane protein n=1 Tax=Anncaliia algerae PRA339 TaxID=1288291 RepID=A0A059F560_9MICR|nr:hypothetical protein H312_00091 [Anncaliia algerae PRA339]